MLLGWSVVFYVLNQTVAIGNVTHRHQPATTKARQRSHAIQQHHIPRQSATETSQPERDAADEETHAPAEDVGEAAVERLEGGAGDEVRRRQPRGGVGGVELGADDGVRRGGDGPVEAVQEDVGHDGQLDPGEARRGLPRFAGGYRGGGVAEEGLVFAGGRVSVGVRGRR